MIMVHKKSALMPLLSQIFQDKEAIFVAETYCIIFSRDETTIDAIRKTYYEIFLLSEQSRPFPVCWNTIAATEDSRM